MLVKQGHAIRRGDTVNTKFAGEYVRRSHTKTLVDTWRDPGGGRVEEAPGDHHKANANSHFTQPTSIYIHLFIYSIQRQKAISEISMRRKGGSARDGRGGGAPEGGLQKLTPTPQNPLPFAPR